MSNNCWYLPFDLGPGMAVWKGPIAMKKARQRPHLVAVNKKVKTDFTSLFHSNYFNLTLPNLT
jgi:hypothetical protein